MTITIEVSENRYDELRTEATGLGVSVEQLATRILEPKPEQDEAFRQAMADTLRKNHELYRRLAK